MTHLFFNNFLLIKKRSITAIWGFSCRLVQSKGSSQPFCHPERSDGSYSPFVFLSEAKDLLSLLSS